MKKYLLILFIIQFISMSAIGQLKVKENVDAVKTIVTPTKIAPFIYNPNTSAITATEIENKVFKANAKPVYLSLNDEILKQTIGKNPQFVEFSIPISEKETLYLELIPANIFSSDFKLTTNDGATVPYEKGKFYRGIIKNSKKSLVAISIVDGEISGIISDSLGNRALEKKTGTNNYILYDDNSLNLNFNFQCGFADTPLVNGGNIKEIEDIKGIGNKIIKVYFKCDYQMYLDKGSNTNVSNYVTSFFNQVATLYQNENIEIQISEISVYDFADPYRSMTDTGSILNAFRTTLAGNFNGDLAHFLTTRNFGAGVAYLNTLCNKPLAIGVSAVYNQFSNVPNYSSTVYVVTHELGHNIGSPHTQSCSWSGGPIDNCAVQEDGSCSPGPTPTNGGTIMSYCHKNSYINFSNGFGTQPGNLIRSRVLNATCLISSNSNDDCSNASILTPNTTCITTQGDVTGATASGISNPSCDNVSTGLKDVWYKFTTSTAGNYTIDVTGNGDFDAVTALYSNCSGTQISGACSDLPSPSHDSHIVASLAASTTYYIRVYEYGANDPVTKTFNICVISPTGCTQLSPPTANNANNITQTSFQANWATNGADSYEIDVSTTPTFNIGTYIYQDLDVGNTNFYNIVGLSCETPYHYRVRAKKSCGTESLPSSSITITTAMCSSGQPNLTLNGPVSTATLGTNSITYNITIINNGNSISNQSRVGFYLSTSPLFASLNYFVGSVAISSLGAGSSSNLSATFNLCGIGQIPNGTYYYGLFIDDQLVVAESNETDNLWYWGTNTFTLNCTTCTIPATPPTPSAIFWQCGLTTISGIQSGLPPSGVTWYWQGNSCGTRTDLGSTANHLNVSAGGTYYLRAYDNVGNCWSTNCSSTTVSVFQYPSPPSSISGNLNINSGGSTSLTAVGCSETAKWYDAPTGGNLIYTGNPFNVSPISTITYYANCRLEFCDSQSRTSVTVTVNTCVDNPTLPNITAGMNQTVKAPNIITAINQVHSGGIGNYQAPVILLNPGFRVANGAVFTAKNGNCNN